MDAAVQTLHVQNTLMFSQLQKSVARGPFRSVLMPTWFALQGNKASKAFPKLIDMEVAHAAWKVPGILWSALRG